MKDEKEPYSPLAEYFRSQNRSGHPGSKKGFMTKRRRAQIRIAQRDSRKRIRMSHHA